MTRALPFTVIGGYLGAGKTTLLNNLLSQAGGLRAAVLVNDFGEINIDAELITGHDGDAISLANGCICCSLSNGFAVAIGEVLKRAEKLDHVIVEASGVAEPGKIAQYGQMYGLPLDGVLVVVDAEQIKTQADNKYVGDTVLRQLAQATCCCSTRSTACRRRKCRRFSYGCLRSGARASRSLTTVRADAPLSALIGRALVRLIFDACAIGRFAADGPDHETKTSDLDADAQPPDPARGDRAARN